MKNNVKVQDDSQSLQSCVSGSSSNKCDECSKELEKGTVFCSADCRIHYYH